MPQRSLGQAPGTWVASSLHVCIPSIWLGVTPSASLTKKKVQTCDDYSENHICLLDFQVFFRFARLTCDWLKCNG